MDVSELARSLARTELFFLDLFEVSADDIEPRFFVFDFEAEVPMVLWMSRLEDK